MFVFFVFCKLHIWNVYSFQTDAIQCQFNVILMFIFQQIVVVWVKAKYGKNELIHM